MRRQAHSSASGSSGPGAAAGPPGKLTAIAHLLAVTRRACPDQLEWPRHHNRTESHARPANPASATGSSATTGNCMDGLPSTSTRNAPTVSWAAIGATSGSCGVHTGSTLAPAGTVT
ncbi:hypothetical protein G6F22_020090 [Rhizopus arrhizus]|nr:hypothetical protein G6F22_020090 [Rhizopus arrhizus]